MNRIIKYLLILIVLLLSPCYGQFYIVKVPTEDVLIYKTSVQQNRTFEVKSILEVYKQTQAIGIINGTFFDINNSNQPLGCVFDGKYLWIPTTRIFDGTKAKLLNRYYFIIDKNNNAIIEQGNYKIAYKYFKEKAKYFIGGNGPLIKNYNINLTKESLKESKFRDSVIRRYSIIPRTAIGITEDNFVIFIVSPNITLDGLAEIMLKQNVKDAIFLDGGGSSGLMLFDEIYIYPRRQPTYILIK